MRIFLRLLGAATILLFAVTVAPYLDPGNHHPLHPVDEVSQRVRVLGYDRQGQFGGWQPGVREQVVARAGELDPYTGKPFDHGAGEVDHILPLSAAWDLGAHSWTTAERIRFANDPENLVLVSREQNQQKSDQLPGRWLPPDRGARCWYVARMTKVAHGYQLPLPSEDIKSGRRQCGFAKVF
ncbi:HNH endonuclease family protein [Corynebacterium pacaense]|uniref:HNH endonuclease family protein n=1 Tax=Corynebacterium pacaense TaxID=1816684 RepID=UPI0009BB4A57|nr:HNH endonuclease family protein [Corynebacterium pacaense]